MDERRLWGAVLLQAVKDCVGYALVGNERERRRIRHRERLTAVKANIRALDKVDIAAGVRNQKKDEAQQLAGAL